MTASTWQNWSGLASTSPTRILSPHDPAEVADAVRTAHESGHRIKMPGTGHSFTDIALADDILLRPESLRGITAVDREALTVTMLAGTPLHVMNAELERLGLSLHNMGDIDQQTIAGATSTGTHGTGGTVASLAVQIAGMDLVTGDGTTMRLSAQENPDVFAVARLGLGALGIITSITMAVEPVFTLEAYEHPMLWDEVLDSLDELEANNHHFEFYWFPHTDRCLVKENNRILEPAEPLGKVRGYIDDELLSNTLFGAINRVGNARPSLIPKLNALSGRALSARRFSDVPHRVFTSPRTVRFREMEYAVPRAAGPDALREVRALIDRSDWKISFPVEVRVAPADDIPLSTASARDVMYLAFHVNKQTDHRAYFESVEQVLKGYDGRPHWGKLHTRTAADLAPAYPRWDEFIAVRDRLDPDRVFTNPYLRRVLGD
ncbi:MAG TPA: D-arabinono-1,4-lactone oxidase [Marmoricola sp.]